MEKRYQVFVSSTYADLMEERQKVIQALMEMDCIPAGMELFPAADEEQWEFIKRIIEDCDYYVLIVGGRYGSLTAEGISYTEKEYDYAISLGLQVLAFIHENPDEIPVSKSDIEPDLRKKLDYFRERISQSRLVKYWRYANELPGLVALSLSKTIKVYPAIGWVRANNVSSDELLTDLNELRKENQVLRTEVSKLEAETVSDVINLASIDETYDFTLRWKDYGYTPTRTVRKEVSASWSEIFASVAPNLISHPSDQSVNNKLGSAMLRKVHFDPDKHAEVDQNDFLTIRTQLEALGLVKLSYSKTVSGSMALFWTLTKNGKALMVQLRTVKSNGVQPTEA